MIDAVLFGPAGGFHRRTGAGAVDQDAFLAVGGARLFKSSRYAFVGGDVDFAKHAADFSGDGFALVLSADRKCATFTPFAASARAVAAPRPDAPPVMTAETVESSFMLLLSSLKPLPSGEGLGWGLSVHKLLEWGPVDSPHLRPLP